MAQVSKNKLSKKTEEELIKHLNLVFSNINAANEMTMFIDTILTPTEKLMLAKRLAIVVLLKETLPDSKIAEMLHVTRITVAKMRYYNEAHGEGFSIALKKLQEQNQLRNFKKILLSLTRYAIRASHGYLKPTILD